MSDPTIAIIRDTSIVTDDWVAGFAKAQQIQIDRDFRPLWHLGATVVFVAAGQVVPAGAWQVWLMDHSDQADALGYHDLAAGLPVAKVFIADDMADGASPSVTISHEILEMLGDPNVNQTVTFSERDGTTWEYAYEVCDACEDDQFGDKIGDYLMTDFVLPTWFDLTRSGPTSFRGSTNGPFALADGGYIGRREVAPNPGQWSQLLARGIPGRRTRKGPHSRTMRRFAQTPSNPVNG